MNAQAAGRKTIKAFNGVVNILVLTIIMLLLAYAAYALWDSDQIYHQAEKSQYTAYKPTVEDAGKSFKELQSINPEVFSWLTVYGTGIDYPVVQGMDNMKYVNTNAEGQYSLSGAIFLDAGNNNDFNDFNSILYGHHMEKKAMFGDIGTFSNRDIFDSTRYGNLYYDGKDHGIEFFAFAHVDAYDNKVFNANVKGEKERQEYLNYLLEKSMHKRDIGVTITDHIILLSTCSSSSTNGRDILIGVISDEMFADTFIKTETSSVKSLISIDSQPGLSGLPSEIPQWIVVAALIFVALLLLLLFMERNNRNRKWGIDI